jgi:hypothetical protein
VFGLAAAFFYVRDSYVYFSSYFARLIRPVASVAPLPPTGPEQGTEETIAEHDPETQPAPEILSMTANVSMSKRSPGQTWTKPYTEQIENNTLKVIEQSTVALHVQASEKLNEIAITGLDGKTVTKQLNGAKEFTFHFKAERNGSIKFDMVGDNGPANDDLPALEVVVKADEPPKLELLSPEGDYLTTDVASVPITFEITDDFGLDSAKVRIEIPGLQPRELVIPVGKGARIAEYTHTIELEQYELTIGDSILFHAEATDIDTGSAQAGKTSTSEMYFIEIRHYRQNWRSGPTGSPGQSAGAAPPVGLVNILEYTRAILKKTWAVAGKPNLTDTDRSALDSIDNDVRYCAEQLALIRDDSENGFDNRHKVVLNMVLRFYELASKHLAGHDATSAIPPEKDAYRLLRKFILELELQWNPPSAGQSPQPDQPDSVTLREQPEFSQYDKQRIDDELKQARQELKKLSREQKKLKEAFENFLGQQQGGEGPSGSDGQTSERETDPQRESPSDDENPDKNQSGEQSQGSSQRSAADAEARLRMLEARQRALQQRASELKRALEQLPEGSEGERGQGRTEAQEHLGEAIDKMEDSQRELAEARYRADTGNRESQEAAELMESARSEMDLAAEALDGERALSNEERIAQEAQKIAEQLAEDADALDESVTPQERQEMLDRLEAAKRLLETMPEPQWTTTDQSKSMRSAAGLVLTRGPEFAAAEAARQLARQFWSISIEAAKRAQQLSEDEPSDVKFYGQENEFFENAAKFDAESVQK